MGLWKTLKTEFEIVCTGQVPLERKGRAFDWTWRLIYARRNIVDVWQFVTWPFHSCTNHIVKAYDDEDSIPKCRVCRRWFGGWYCPKAPKHLCVYPEGKGQFECIYCKGPDERK